MQYDSYPEFRKPFLIGVPKDKLGSQVEQSNEGGNWNWSVDQYSYNNQTRVSFILQLQRLIRWNPPLSHTTSSLIKQWDQCSAREVQFEVLSCVNVPDEEYVGSV